MNKNHLRTERRRVKRLRKMKGRLTAFGSKTYPNAVKYEMAAAAERRKKGDFRHIGRPK